MQIWNGIIIEDDPQISGEIAVFLKQKGLDCQTYPSLKQFTDSLKTRSSFIPDFIILDWNLPDGQGPELCAEIRKNFPDTIILMLTIRDMSQDIIYGLQSGCDEYMTKPFSLEILYARLQALLRRSVKSRVLSCGNITLDLQTMQVKCGDIPVSLSAGESHLLEILMRHKNQLLTRSQLKQLLWEMEETEVNDNTLSVCMKRLRHKLNIPGCIKTVRGLGYRMEE